MILVGAGGHARELLDVLIDNGCSEKILFFDNLSQTNTVAKRYQALHTREEVLNSGIDSFCVAVGKPHTRAELFALFMEFGLKPLKIISRKAFVSGSAQLSEGLNIMPFASITHGAKVGKGCLIHFYSSVHHDVEVGDFCEISPGARLLGGSSVGELTSVGTNAVILPKVKVGSNCKIGAGAVVTKDVPDGSTVKGVPAKK